MTGSQSYIGVPNGIVVCVDRVGGERICGRFYHNYSRQPERFGSAEQLVFGMEHLFDTLKYPQPTTDSRSFNKRLGTDKRDFQRRPAETSAGGQIADDSPKTTDSLRDKDSFGRERVKMMDDNELLSKHGDLGSFIIRVQHRQNSSWQGKVTWIEQNKTVYFRSVWEMIKLIESAVNSVNGPAENTEETTWE